jgi:ribonuclease BN (tRNA processing enzyme)
LLAVFGGNTASLPAVFDGNMASKLAGYTKTPKSHPPIFFCARAFYMLCPMKITLLGTGTPTPSLKRMCSSYLVEIGQDKILFDHGFGSHHRLLEAGLRATDITHLFFSHLHYDHCGDYTRLLLTRWDQGAGKIPELKVFGPPPLANMTRLLFGRDGAFGPDLQARTENRCSLDIYEARGGVLPRRVPAPQITELCEKNMRVQTSAWKIIAAPVMHFEPQLTPYGYRLESAEGIFVYSGDTGPSDGMRTLAKGCDVLVHMCHQLSGTAMSLAFAQSCMGHLELAELGTQSGAKNLVLTHITEQMDRPGVRERVIAEMSKIYRGNLFFGEDLMEIPVAAPTPAKLM